jgi:hypothetical protein
MLMKRWYITLAALLAVAMSAQYAAAQNLLANPGFEDPTSTTTSVGNWFRFGSGAQGVSNESTAMPHGGQRHIELTTAAPNQFAGVFQRLPRDISPGAVVTFTGFHKSVLSPYNATSEIKIEWQGGPPQNRVDVLTLGTAYEMFTHSAVAPPNTTGAVITYAISTFGPGQGEALVYIDDFSATVIPEPATAFLLGISLFGLIGVRRRK